MSLCLLCFFIAFGSFSIVVTVPPDYCLSPLNQSDCHKEPTPVFSYYKPGSRCEIQTWRGCPTLNKFENEYVCSLNCLFRVMRRASDEEEESDLVIIDECAPLLNGGKCTNQTETVYTHVNGKCVEATWRGCVTYNKFPDKAACDTACKTVVTEAPIEEKLKELDETPLEEINEILKDLIEEEFTTEPPTTTVAESEPETEPHSDHESTEEEETTTPEPTEPTTNDDYEEVIHAI